MYLPSCVNNTAYGTNIEYYIHNKDIKTINTFKRTSQITLNITCGWHL